VPPVGSSANPQSVERQKEAEFSAKLKAVKSDIKDVKDALDALPEKKVEPKVVYRTRTKTVPVKPKEIILYVRHADGGITEHKVFQNDGFYIVHETDITQPAEPEYIIIRDTIIQQPEKRTLWQRIRGN